MGKQIIFIEATEDTPLVEVQVEKSDCSVLVKGVSMPENTLDFYEPLREQLTANLQPDHATSLVFELEYMNSMSNKQVLKIIDLLRKKCANFKLTWKYSKGDDLIKMKGEEIKLAMKGLDMSILEC
jgi:hypothetical protein